jgi:hypothetical protein
MRFIPVLGMVLFLCMATVTAYTDQLVIGDFSRLAPGGNLPDPWEPMTFKNIDRQTSYALIQDNGRTIIRAHSQNSASGLIHPLRVNPEEYPVIKWRWVTEERNILKDYAKAFGRNPPEIIGIGIMTDTDDTGGETTGYYGDITLLRLPD